MTTGTQRVLVLAACAGLCTSAWSLPALEESAPPAAPADLAPNDAALDNAGFPNFDIRFDGEGRPTPAVMQAIAAHPKTAAWHAAAERLRARVEFVTIDEDAALGTPQFVRSWKQHLTGPNPGIDAPVVVRNFINDYAGLFEIDPAEVTAARVTRDFVTEHNGVRHLTFQQTIGGIDLFGAGIKANVMPDGRLINVSSTLLARPAGDFAKAKGALSELDAIRAAAASVGITMTADPTPDGDAEGVSEKRRWKNSADFRQDRAITTERVYFARTRASIVPAWWVVIPTKGVGHTYRVVIDANDGTLLHRIDELCSELGTGTMLVYTEQAPNPGYPTACGGTASRRLVTVNPSDPTVTVPSPFGWFDNNGVAGPEFTDTRGNNVDAHLDVDANNVADAGGRPSGGASLMFNPVQDLTLEPPFSWQGPVVQAFYYANLYHDRLYSLGFTEAAGNFQTNNYGRGGLGNDAVQLDVQDGSGTNNANFGTPIDGTAGRCQMYLWTAATPDRDSSMDAQILYHELTHGLSTRLTGGPANSNSLDAIQSGGMGEGWSDFVALCLTATANDNPSGAYPMGTYSINHSCTGAGIRRRPYSTDTAIDPLTWDAYGTTGTTPYGITRSTQVHNTGEIWCTTLWDCRGKLRDSYGFAANELILRLVVDAMKLQPANPSFVQARDAVLQADLALTGGANARALWTAFAGRGLGSGASSGASTSTALITLSSTVPASENGYSEGSDVGNLPSSAQTVYSAAAPTRITGTLTASDADMYRITICDRTVFTATTVGGPAGFNTFDSQLFLFTLAGNPVVFNDNAGAAIQSTITGASVPANGDYLLAVSGADRDPVSAGGAQWLDTPVNTQRTGDGPGAGSPITGWTGTGVAGSYSIQLTGACAVAAPAAATGLTANGAASPNVVYTCAGPTNVNFSVYVKAGTLPASSGTSVSLDASPVGLGTIPLTGPGGGNGSFTGSAAVSPSLADGHYFLPYTVSDAQGRTFNGTILYTVSTVGVCCLPDGSCTQLTCSACAVAGGNVVGGQFPCTLGPCSAPSETEPNNSTAQANNADLSYTLFSGDVHHMGFTGGIATSTDADYFNIGALQAGDVLTATQSGSPTGAGTNPDPLFRLYRAGTGTTIITSDDDAGPGFDALVWQYTIANTDTYYARGHRATTSSLGTYRIGLLLENTGTQPSTGSSFSAEAEPNETMATANNASSAWRPVQFVSTHTGAMTPADQDYFAYSLTAGDIVSIRVYGEAGLDARVTLRNAAGTAIALEDGTSTGPVNDSIIEGFRIPSTGTYYVQVHAGGTGNYMKVLMLSTTSPPSLCDTIDFNNDGLFPDTLDLDDFIAVFGGAPCSNDPNCNDIDFNNDGLFPDTLDIDALISVFGGGPCL